MDVLNCIAVDDDPMTLKIVESFIEQTDFLKHLKSCQSAVEASNVLKEEKVDLVFLDVEMPQMTGLEFIESLENAPQIILITSKEKYAVDAFEYAVTDYIVKPVQYPRFLKAANRALEISKRVEEVEVRKDTLFVKVNSRLISIKIPEIDYIEAKADYVTIHTEHGRYTVYSTMKGIVKKLPPNDFLRVHRSFIINTNKIDSIEDNTLVIGKKLIPVGITYKEKLLKNLNLL